MTTTTHPTEARTTDAKVRADELTAIRIQGERVLYFSWAAGRTFEMTALGASYHGIDLRTTKATRQNRRNG